MIARVATIPSRCRRLAAQRAWPRHVPGLRIRRVWRLAPRDLEGCCRQTSICTWIIAHRQCVPALLLRIRTALRTSCCGTRAHPTRLADGALGRVVRVRKRMPIEADRRAISPKGHGTRSSPRLRHFSRSNHPQADEGRHASLRAKGIVTWSVARIATAPKYDLRSSGVGSASSALQDSEARSMSLSGES